MAITEPDTGNRAELGEMNGVKPAAPGRILYIQYTNPAAYPPLEHSSRILADAGWEVVLLGTAADDDLMRFPPHRGIDTWVLRRRVAGWRQKLHYLWFSLWVLGWALRWQPHFVYASGHLVCPTALVLILIARSKVIYHEHDAPHSSRESVFQRCCLMARKWLSRRAAFCIIPSEKRLEGFLRDTDAENRVLCVWNCPSQDEIPPPRSQSDDEELWLWYHGSIVPSQLPSSVVRALTKLPEQVKLRVAGYETIGHRGYVAELKELAKNLGLNGRVDFVGTLPTRHELFDRCRACHVGLALFSKTTVQPMTGASNKPFDYLACGLSLLVPDMADWRDFFVTPGFGISCNPDDGESIASAIQWYLDHPAERRVMSSEGREKIKQEWNYESQFQRVLESLTAQRDG